MHRWRTLTVLLVCAGASSGLFGHPRSVPSGNAGAPGDANPPCSSCHRVTLNPATGGKVEVTFPEGLRWRAGQKQSWTVRITEPDSSRRHGFQLTSRPAGAVSSPAGSNTGTVGAYIYHTASQASYNIDWTPPAGAEGEIKVYIAALTGRGTNNSNVYTAVYTLAPAGGPALESQNAVLNAASFEVPIAGGSWAMLKGQNLSPAGVTRTWRADDIVDGRLPTSLDGVSVKVDGRDAYVYYISPSQINVLVPDTPSLGSVPVQVTTSAGSSSSAATLSLYAPAFFTFDPRDRRYAAALSAQYETIAPEGLFGAALVSRSAKPGETILVYGTGFGPTAPAGVVGASATGVLPLAELSQLRVTVGGLVAKVAFAGIVSPGLYQLNVEIPDLPDGDHAVSAEIGGMRTQTGVYLSVKR